jgi:hypothetical protein
VAAATSAEARGIGDDVGVRSHVETGGFFQHVRWAASFGDWNQNNNFLRAFIAGGNGLTVAWAGVTHWFFQHMGMGETIGVGTRHHDEQSSSASTCTFANVEVAGGNGGNVYLGLMGDPTLRQGHAGAGVKLRR